MVVSDAVVVIVAVATFGLLFFRQIRVYPLSRSITAATGAVVVLVVGGIGPDAALASVDTGTILLLFGMLAHVEALSGSGFYDWAAGTLVRRTGTTRRLTLGTLGLTALLGAIALNDGIVILMTPVLVEAIDGTATDPVAPLLAVVFGANIGSVATPLGNPQNAYILANSGLSAAEFVAHLAPIAFVSILIAAIGLSLVGDNEPLELESVPEPTKFDRLWALSSAAFLLATFVLLVVLPTVDPGVVAASMGVLHIAWLQAFRLVPGNEVLSGMDWGVLVLFVGLFVVIGGLEGTPVLGVLQSAAGGWRLVASTFVLSNLVSNVPAVVLLSTAVEGPRGWYVLAAVSTLAGNATPIASAATLIVLDGAGRRGVDVPLSRFVRLGFPIAITTCLVAGIALLCL